MYCNSDTNEVQRTKIYLRGKNQKLRLYQVAENFVNANGVSEENWKQALSCPDLGEFLWEFQKSSVYIEGRMQKLVHNHSTLPK